MTKGDLISASCAPQDVQCAEAFHELGATAVYENEPVVQKSQVVFMAVKPFVAPTVLQEISPVFSKDHLLISVAMGVTLQQMEKVRVFSYPFIFFKYLHLDNGRISWDYSRL